MPVRPTKPDGSGDITAMEATYPNNHDGEKWDNTICGEQSTDPPKLTWTVDRDDTSPPWEDGRRADRRRRLSQEVTASPPPRRGAVDARASGADDYSARQQDHPLYITHPCT